MTLPTLPFENAPPWLATASDVAIALAIAIPLALIAHAVVVRLMMKLALNTATEGDSLLARRLARPLRWAFVAVAVALAAREVDGVAAIWGRISGLLVPALLGWVALTVLKTLTDAATARADLDRPDNLSARRRLTRLAIFSRIGAFVIVFITIALMLFSIPSVKTVGVTLMASAGLAGLALGAAAQPALKSLLAGLQMALTEPIRIDDVIIIDGEYGRVEDIRTTYVVVRLWDERRLVVPTVRFLEETFQNWTRQSAELLGTVFLHVDPATDVAAVRAQAVLTIEVSDHWDGRVAKMQVTDTTAETLQLRLLMSAANAPTLFDLRCEVREAMATWLRESMPEAIPRNRIELSTEPATEN